MKTLLMCIAMFLLSGSQSFANTPNLTEAPPLDISINICGALSGSSVACNAIEGCTYDYRYQRCIQSYRRDRRSACGDFDYSPRVCEDRYGCVYDWRRDRCVDDRYDRGRDGDRFSRSCSRYDNRPRQCDDQRECRYDYRRDRCRARY